MTFSILSSEDVALELALRVKSSRLAQSLTSSGLKQPFDASVLICIEL